MSQPFPFFSLLQSRSDGLKVLHSTLLRGQELGRRRTGGSEEGELFVSPMHAASLAVDQRSFWPLRHAVPSEECL
jgi:hypothetical protein